MDVGGDRDDDHGGGTGVVRHLPGRPRGPHRGVDPSGTVSVEIDDAERDVRVALATGWRDRVGAEHLEEAVTEAVTGAVAARAAAAPLGPPQLYDTAVVVVDPGGPARITVRGGDLVSIAGTTDADLVARLGDTLRAALAAVGDLPERAFDGPPARLVERS